jgi:YVTN family beta-propeller protein
MLKATRTLSTLPDAKVRSLKKAGVRLKLLALVLTLVSFVAVPIGQSVRAEPTCNFNVIATINVDIHPFGVTTSPDGNTVWVANSGSPFVNSNKVTIIIVNTLTEEPMKITVGNFPEDIAFTDDGAQAFVTNSSDATVSVIDTASRTVTQTVSLAPVSLTFPFGIVTSKNDKKVFVTTQGGSANSIAVLDNRNRNNVTVAGTIPASGFTGRPALRSIGNELLVPASGLETGPPKFLVINPSSGNVMHELTLQGNTAFPNDVAVTPDGRFAYVTLFDFSGGTGGVWVIDLMHLRTVTVINTGDPNVFGIGMTPDGRFAFATNFIQNTVAVIKTATNTVVATVPVGRQPNEVAVSLDGTKAFVTNQNDTTVSVICIPQS